VTIDDMLYRRQRLRDRAQRRTRRAMFAQSKATAYTVRRAMLELDLRRSIDDFLNQRAAIDRFAFQYLRRARLLYDSALDMLTRGGVL